MTQWKPIESAPKDGSKIIIHTYTGKTDIAWFCSETGLWPHDDVYCEDGDPCNVGYPTHWMPIPQPPERDE